MWVSVCSFACLLLNSFTIEWTFYAITFTCALISSRHFWLFHIGVNTFRWFPHISSRKKTHNALIHHQNNTFIVIMLLHFRNELLPHSFISTESHRMLMYICICLIRFSFFMPHSIAYCLLLPPDYFCCWMNKFILSLSLFIFLVSALLHSVSSKWFVSDVQNAIFHLSHI